MRERLDAQENIVEENKKIRELYIRARYCDKRIPTTNEVRQIKELVREIKGKMQK